jgi:nitrogenase molybdenum-iron protein alpha chain
LSYTAEKTIPTREKRTGALSHFHGTATELEAAVSGEIAQRIRTFSQAGPDELISVLRALATISNTAVIVHGASGCAIAGLTQTVSGGAKIFTTDMAERETILGGDEILRYCLLQAAASLPDAIFIVGTPVTAISNDDVASVILELAEEISAPLIFLKSDGFHTKAAVTGYDLVGHALLRHLVAEPENTPEKFLNVISFSEGLADIAAFTSLLDQLQIKYNLLPRFSSVAAIRRAASAGATIALNPDEGEILALGLEEDFGVKYLNLPAPVGNVALAQIITALGEQFDRAATAEALITRQTAELSELIARQPLRDKRIFIHLELAAAAGAASLARSLGGRICGYSIPYVDERNREKLTILNGDNPEVTAIVGGQPFELVNALSKLQPDIYWGGPGEAAVSARVGVYPLILGENMPLYGYEGIRTVADAVLRPIFPLYAESDGYYKPEWLKKSGNWYIKREVN